MHVSRLAMFFFFCYLNEQWAIEMMGIQFYTLQQTISISK